MDESSFNQLWPKLVEQIDNETCDVITKYPQIMTLKS